jgi:hypothetical protein
VVIGSGRAHLFLTLDKAMEWQIFTHLWLHVGPTFGRVHSSVTAGGILFGRAWRLPVEKICTFVPSSTHPIPTPVRLQSPPIPSAQSPQTLGEGAASHCPIPSPPPPTSPLLLPSLVVLVLCHTKRAAGGGRREKCTAVRVMPSPNEQVVASGSSAAVAGRAGGGRQEQPRRHTPCRR